MKNVVCRVAVIGAGYMASQHLQAFSGLPDVELVGIFSRSSPRATEIASRFPGMLVCESVGDLYEKTRPDLVVVTVNELSMNTVAHECFEFPWNILLEKPAGHDLQDASDIMRGAHARGRNVFVALNRRNYASTRLVLEKLRLLNGIRFIKVQDQEDIVEASAHGKPDGVIANWMFANAIHVIDYFRIFGRGEITGVTPVVEWNAKDPKFVVAHIQFSSGDIGLYEAIWNGPGPWAVSINAGPERYELRPLEQAAVQLNGQRKLSVFPADPIDSEYKPGLRHQAEQAVRAARGEASELTTIDDAFQSMHLAARIYGLDRL